MTAIETRGLTKRFAGGRFGRSEPVVAVDDLDLTVEEGTVFGFLGPNGAGKSTTINLLLDFIRPTAGEARLFGMDANTDSTAIADRIGVLPEGYGFDGSLTAREYVDWTVRTKAARDDPGEILSTVGLADAADRPVDGFSTGMRQRLAFGMALVGDPDLLLMDEPSAGLDPNGIQRIREIVRERAANGTTIFFSSHVLGEVEAVCDRVGVMNEGELVAVDTIDELRRRVGRGTTIRVECAPVPDPAGVTSLDGVHEAKRDDQTLVVRCASAGDKVDVVRHLADRTTVRNILSSPVALEELFNTYTEGGRDGGGGGGGVGRHGAGRDGDAVDDISAERDDAESTEVSQ